MSLFPLEQPDAASDKLTVLLSELKRSVGQLCDPDVRIGGSFAASMKKSRPAAATAAPDAMEPEESAQQQREVRRLQNVIGTLQQELGALGPVCYWSMIDTGGRGGAVTSFNICCASPGSVGPIF